MTTTAEEVAPCEGNGLTVLQVIKSGYMIKEVRLASHSHILMNRCRVTLLRTGREDGLLLLNVSSGIIYRNR